MKKKNLKLYLFNVGHGDHILIEFPNGKFGIIDFHYQANLNMTEVPALTYFKYLKSIGKTVEILFMCFSHADMDHLKGVNKFLEWIDKNEITVDHILMFAGEDPDSLIQELYEFKNLDNPEYKAYEKRLKSIDSYVKKWELKTSKHVNYLNNIQKDLIIEDEIVIHCMAPMGFHIKDYDKINRRKFLRSLFDKNGDYYKIQGSNRNNASSILQINYKNYNIILGGDATTQVWSDIIEECKSRNIRCDADFIKVSHHGSKHSSSVELWEEIVGSSKTVIAISAGKREYFPHPEMINHIYQVCKNTKEFELYRTNRCIDCVDKLQIEGKQMDWFDVMKNMYSEHTKVSESLDRSESENDIVKGRLLFYMYEFKKDNIKVIKGIWSLPS